MEETTISHSLKIYDLNRMQIDLSSVNNRRFMYHSSGILILGAEDVVKSGTGLMKSHAEEYGEACEGIKEKMPPYDEFVRGWIGVGTDYPHGIIHFAPQVTASYIPYYNSAYDFIEAALGNGFANSSILRGFCEPWEQPISNIVGEKKQMDETNELRCHSHLKKKNHIDTLITATNEICGGGNMVSINGLSVKSMAMFRGHEGETLAQGDLYLNNQKIGFWSQDSWGGPDHFSLESNCSYRLLNEAVKKRNENKAICEETAGNSVVVEYDLELLLYDYVKLVEDEKEFNKAKKAGYDGILIATDGYHQTLWQLPQSYTHLSNQELLRKMASDLETAKKSFWKENRFTKHVVKIYRSADDFVIGDSISMDEILAKKPLEQTIAAIKEKAEQLNEKSPNIKKEEPDRALPR